MASNTTPTSVDENSPINVTSPDSIPPPITVSSPVETLPVHSNASAPTKSSNPVNAIVPINAVYYPNWKVYTNSPPSSLDLARITHVNYAFAFLKPDGTIYLSDEHADTQAAVDGTKGALSALRNLKHKNPKLKTVLSIGGGGKGSVPFAGMAHSAKTRENFATSVKETLDKYGFDGVDIVDWEHPSDAAQGADYTTLLQTLRKHLPTPKYLITSALPCGTWALKFIDLGKAASYMDFINLMAYDFAGPWTKLSGFQAQLYAPPNAPADMSISGQSTVQYMISKKVPAKKIVLGIPAYGHSFLGVSFINQTYKGSGGQDGTFEYNQLPRPGTKEQVDRQAVAAYCVGGDGGLVTYDNAETVKMKAQYVKKEKLGGLFYWTGPGDMKGPRSLVAAGYQGLHAA
ncbi:MAG: hypothetical protein Q9228_001229 [Teloschistes exilis]